jgi:hypothetical protein
MRKVPSISGYDVLMFTFRRMPGKMFNSCDNDHIIFNVGTLSVEVRNIRLVNFIIYIIWIVPLYNGGNHYRGNSGCVLKAMYNAI